MWYLLLTIFTYLAAVLETSLVEVIGVGDVTPDLLALTAIVWVLVTRNHWAFLLAGTVGLVGDLLAPGRVGVGAAWMLIIGYAVGRLQDRLKLDHLLWQVSLAGVAVTAWVLLMTGTEVLLGELALPWSSIPVRATAVGAYSAAVSLPILMIVGWILEPLRARQ